MEGIQTVGNFPRCGSGVHARLRVSQLGRLLHAGYCCPLHMYSCCWGTVVVVPVLHLIMCHVAIVDFLVALPVCLGREGV